MKKKAFITKLAQLISVSFWDLSLNDVKISSIDFTMEKFQLHREQLHKQSSKFLFYYALQRIISFSSGSRKKLSKLNKIKLLNKSTVKKFPSCCRRKS
jgi:hypothetical protein